VCAIDAGGINTRKWFVRSAYCIDQLVCCPFQKIQGRLLLQRRIPLGTIPRRPSQTWMAPAGQNSDGFLLWGTRLSTYPLVVSFPDLVVCRWGFKDGTIPSVIVPSWVWWPGQAKAQFYSEFFGLAICNWRFSESPFHRNSCASWSQVIQAIVL
jgi:hypothetical protein